MIDTTTVIDGVTIGMAVFGAVSAVVRATPTKRPEEIRNGFVRIISAIFQSSRFKRANEDVK